MRCSYCGKVIKKIVPIKMCPETVLGFLGGNITIYCSQKCHDLMTKKYK